MDMLTITNFKIALVALMPLAVVIGLAGLYRLAKESF